MPLLDRFSLYTTLGLAAALTSLAVGTAPATPGPASGLYTRQAGVGPQPLWLRIEGASRDGLTLDLGVGSQVLAGDLAAGTGASNVDGNPVVDFAVGPHCRLSVEFGDRAAAVRQYGACARLGGNVGGFYLLERGGA